MPRVRRPARRTPGLPPWDRGECELCARPTRAVYIAGEPVRVGMRPAPLGDRRADVAATPMNDRLEGRYLGKGDRPDPVETVWIRHLVVCPEVPHTEQLELLPKETL